MESTLLHNPLSIPLIDLPYWILDGMEAARRVWIILSYKPANKLAVTASDDDFMRWMWED